MSKSEAMKSLRVAGRVLLAYALLSSQSAWAGQNPQTQDKANSQPKMAQTAGEKQSASAASAKLQSQQAQSQSQESENSQAEEKASGDTSHQGIKVHGHWTIEVRNPDGTVAAHREFENSLSGGPGGGSQALAALLSRTSTLGYWNVTINASGCQGGTVNYCGIQENWPGSGSGPGNSNNLSVTITNANSLTLSGEVAPVLSTQIFSVTTGLVTCTPDISPKACFGNPANTFSYGLTSANVTQSVLSGQTVAVTVVISFS